VAATSGIFLHEGIGRHIDICQGDILVAIQDQQL